MDEGDVVIWMINTSSKILEASWETYKIKQSPRHEDGTKPDARTAKKQVENGF